MRSERAELGGDRVEHVTAVVEAGQRVGARAQLGLGAAALGREQRLLSSRRRSRSAMTPTAASATATASSASTPARSRRQPGATAGGCRRRRPSLGSWALRSACDRRAGARPPTSCPASSPGGRELAIARAAPPARPRARRARCRRSCARSRGRRQRPGRSASRPSAAAVVARTLGERQLEAHDPEREPAVVAHERGVRDDPLAGVGRAVRRRDVHATGPCTERSRPLPRGGRRRRGGQVVRRLDVVARKR